MISNFWIETRKPHWERLEVLVEQCGSRGTVNLSRRELREFGLLYRQVAADLSVLRQDDTGARYSRHLNQLLGSAHSIIYLGKKTSLASLLGFFARDWPALVRRMRGYLAVVASVFLLCAMAGVLLTLHNPDFALQVLGPQMIDSIARHQMWTQSIVAIKPLASGAIMTNNIAVCFMTFAMGVTAGLGTLYMIAFNGLLMGVVGAACGTNGMSLSLWSFIAGHGSLEIPAILLAGAAGLRLGTGLLFPGQLARRESFRLAGSEAVQLELGTVPLLVVAGLIEGFISPLGISPALKFSLGAALLAGLLVWVLSGARVKSDSSASVTADSSASLPDTYSTTRR
jgi:uncharacterized membrane protein SpoIIM required for sporulation